MLNQYRKVNTIIFNSFLKEPEVSLALQDIDIYTIKILVIEVYQTSNSDELLQILKDIENLDKQQPQSIKDFFNIINKHLIPEDIIFNLRQSYKKVLNNLLLNFTNKLNPDLINNIIDDLKSSAINQSKSLANATSDAIEVLTKIKTNPNTVYVEPEKSTKATTLEELKNKITNLSKHLTIK